MTLELEMQQSDQSDQVADVQRSGTRVYTEINSLRLFDMLSQISACQIGDETSLF